MKLHGVTPPAPTYEPIGTRLREVRKHHKLQQGDMAKLLNISRSSYQYYERGERDFPVSLAKSFIVKFQLDAEWFLFGDEGRGSYAETSTKGA